MGFLKAKQEFRGKFWVGPAECAASLGRIMEGGKNQICRKIEGKGQGALGIGSNTLSRVGRRIAPRIPSG